MRTEELHARIRAANRANSYAVRLYEILDSVFRPLVAQKILKKDGSLLAKIQLPKFPHEPGITVFKNSSDYSLSWKVKVCEDTGLGNCLYHEVNVYVGEITRGLGILFTMNYQPPTGEQFDLAAVQELMRKADEAQRIADEARSCLPPFLTHWI